MPERTPATLSDQDYQYAAERALFGRLPVPPKVDPARCEAYLYTFDTPVSDDDGEQEFSQAVAIITRGAQGPFATTACVYAADSDGNPVGDDEMGWTDLSSTVICEGDIETGMLDAMVEDIMVQACSWSWTANFLGNAQSG